MSVSKTALTGGSLAFALLFGGGAYLYMNLGSIAERYIEKIATQTLGVPVTMSKLDISLQNRNATVHNLKIGNPSGFKKPNAMTISKISVTLDTVSQELITFKDISVDKTNVYLEVTSKGTNLNTIKNGIKTQSPSAEPATQPKVIIHRAAMTKAQLNPSVTLLSDQDLSPVVVPDVILTGIGVKSNGILAREAIAQVFSAVMKNVNQAASNAGFFQGLSPDALKDIGTSQVQGIKDKIKGDIDEAAGGLGDVLKGFGN